MPTEMEIIVRSHGVFLGEFSFFHSGKKAKHNKNNAVVTVSTTSCVKAKSGARNRTNKIAIANPIYPLINIAANLDDTNKMVTPATIIEAVIIHKNIVIG